MKYDWLFDPIPDLDQAEIYNYNLAFCWWWSSRGTEQGFKHTMDRPPTFVPQVSPHNEEGLAGLAEGFNPFHRVPNDEGGGHPFANIRRQHSGGASAAEQQAEGAARFAVEGNAYSAAEHDTADAARLAVEAAMAAALRGGNGAGRGRDYGDAMCDDDELGGDNGDGGRHDESNATINAEAKHQTSEDEDEDADHYRRAEADYDRHMTSRDEESDFDENDSDAPCDYG